MRKRTVLILGILILSALPIYISEAQKGETQTPQKEEATINRIYVPNKLGIDHIVGEKSVIQKIHRKTNLQAEAVGNKGNDFSTLPLSADNYEQDNVVLTATITTGNTVDLTISGVLKGTATDDYWDNEEVELYREGYASQNATTNSLGEYRFDLTYSLSEVGSHNFTVRFYGAPPPIPGFPSVRPAKNLTRGIIEVKVNINVGNINKIPNQQKILPLQNYSYDVSLTYPDGTAFNPATFSVQDEFNNPVTASGMQAIFTETYKDSTGDSTNPNLDQTTRLDNSVVQFTSSTVSIDSNAGNQTITTNIDLLFQLSGISTDLRRFVSFNRESISTASIYTVDINYVFEVHFTLLGKEITTVNQGSETFYRNGTDVYVYGTLIKSVGNTPVVGTEVAIYLTYGPVYPTETRIKTLLTDSLGGFNYTLNLNSTFFTKVQADLPVTVKVLLDPDNKNSNLVDMTASDKVSVRTFGLRANLTSLTFNPIVSTTDTYLSKNSNLAVSGTLSYNTGVAVSQQVIITIAGGSSFENVTAVTNSAGVFSTTIPSSVLSNLDTTIPEFRIYVRLPEIKGKAKTYYNPNNLTTVEQKFNISNGVKLTPTIGLLGSYSGGALDVFNVTLYGKYTSTTANFSFTIVDSVDRGPAGYFLKVVESIIDSSGTTLNQTQYAIKIIGTQTAYTIFLKDFSRALAYQSSTSGIDPFDYENTVFRYSFELVDGSNSSLSLQSTEEYKVYGPDHEVPQLNFASLSVEDTNGRPEDMTIGIYIAGSTKFDNVRRIEMYWRYSDNYLITDVTNATFSTGYNISIMSFNSTSGLFEAVIPFRDLRDHGRWVEYYFVIYDFAGRGLKLDGTTAAQGEYPYPNPEYANKNNYSAQMQYAKLGDTVPPSFSGNPISDDTTFANNVYICENGVCRRWQISGNSVGYLANVTIEVRGLSDENAILNVTLIYSLATYDPFTNQTGSWSNFTVLMLYNSSTGYYYYTFDPTIFGYNTVFDFRITVYDVVGNSDTSVPASKNTQNPNAIVVRDTVAPVIRPPGSSVETGDGQNVRLRPGFNNTLDEFNVWANESISVVVNVTDIGGLGIQNVTIVWSYINSTTGAVIRTATNSSLYPAGTQIVVFTFNFTDYKVNYTIVYELIITDWGNNIVRENSGDKFNIIPIPVPKTNVGETISVITSNGTVITTVLTTSSTAGQAAQRNNSLWILFYFTLGFVALIIFYRWNSIKNYLNSRRRENLVRGTMDSRIDAIRKYGNEGNYKKAILHIWKATQTLGAEALQAPQKFNQTVRDYIDILERVSSIEREKLETLAFSFEKAKYSQEVITADDYKDALEALNVAIDTVIALGVRSGVDDEEDWSDLEFDEQE